MAGVALVSPKIPFFDTLGVPLVGGTLDVYLAGSTTRTNTYQDKAQTTLNTNPIVLDSRGECTLWADDTLTYRFVLKNSAGVQQWDVDNVSGQLVSATLVNFTQSGSGAVTDTAQGKMRQHVSVLDFIAPAEHAAIKAGTSTFDTTSAFAAAFAAHDVVKAPGGLYNVSNVPIAAGKTLLTDGFNTVFQQIAGQPNTTPIIHVQGSNVRIGSIKCIGNIATDTSEFMHAVKVEANNTYGNLENIVIGDVYAKDIRGDGVYLGQFVGHAKTFKNVHIGNVFYDNVLRNGVSVVGGDVVSVNSVQPAGSNRCGLISIDIESDVGAGTCTNVSVGLVKGHRFGMISQSAADYIDNVDIGVVDISPSYSSDSSPTYAPAATVEDGMLLRNVKRARIGQFKASGFNRCAAFVSSGGGEIGAEDVEIGSASVSNCSITDAVYNSYFNWPALTTNFLRIGHLKVDIGVASKQALAGVYAGKVDSVSATIHASSRLLGDCQNMRIGNISQSGGVLGSACVKVNYFGGTYSGSTMFSFNTSCSLYGMTITTSVALYAGTDTHVVIDSTLNGTYYACLLGPTGSVAQATNKTTGVTLNARNGSISMEATGSIAAGAVASFTLTNNKILVNDVIHVHRKSGGTAGSYRVWCDSVAAGSCVICVENRTGGALAEGVVLEFTVINSNNS